MGRIIDAVKQLPDADNTLFIYIAGDNGSSAEGGLEGIAQREPVLQRLPGEVAGQLKAIDELGGPKHFNHFPAAWAHAMDTPFQWTKQVASHFGGTRNPMIVSWPAKIKDKGGLRDQFMHVIDVVPTHLRGDRHHRADASSTACSRSRSRASASRTPSTTRRPRAGGRRSTSRWLSTGASITTAGWPRPCPSRPGSPIRGAFDPDKQKWELYNIDEDFSQANDLAQANPEKLRELQDLWWVEAAKYNVLPLDWRGVERLELRSDGPAELDRRAHKA